MVTEYHLNRLVILQVSVLIGLIHCESQTCDFKPYSFWPRPGVFFYTCVISNANVLNETAGMVTDISSYRNSNGEVQIVDYVFENNITYIPNSIFKTFPKLRSFQISDYSGLEVLKREYFKYADELMKVSIIYNDIKQLDENVFVEAPNLRNLVLSNNKIFKIHKNAFRGLLKLKEIHLEGNNLKILHPKTFSYFSSLRALDLVSNSCIDKFYKFVPTNYSEIEMDILEHCPYNYYKNNLDTLFHNKVEDQKLKNSDMKIETETDYTGIIISTTSENPDIDVPESIFK